MNWMLNVWSPFCCHLGECMSLRSSVRDSADFGGSSLDIWSFGWAWDFPYWEILKYTVMIGTIGSWSSKFFFYIAPSLFFIKPANQLHLSLFPPTSTIQVLWSHLFGSLEHVPLGHLRWLWMSSFGKLHSTSAIRKRSCTPNLQEKSLSPIGTVGRFSILNHEEVAITWMHRVYRADTMSIKELPICWKCAKKLFIAFYCILCDIFLA